MGIIGRLLLKWACRHYWQEKLRSETWERGQDREKYLPFETEILFVCTECGAMRRVRF